MTAAPLNHQAICDENCFHKLLQFRACLFREMMKTYRLDKLFREPPSSGKFSTNHAVIKTKGASFKEYQRTLDSLFIGFLIWSGLLTKQGMQLVVHELIFDNNPEIMHQAGRIGVIPPFAKLAAKYCFCNQGYPEAVSPQPLPETSASIFAVAAIKLTHLLGEHYLLEFIKSYPDQGLINSTDSAGACIVR